METICECFFDEGEAGAEWCEADYIDVEGLDIDEMTVVSKELL